MTQPEQIKITNSRFKAILLTLASLGFVSAGVLILFQPDEEAWLIGWMTVLFFGGCALIGTWMIFDTRPRLIIDRTGIVDRTLGVGKIRWVDVNHAYIKTIKQNHFICLELLNLENYLAKLSPSQKFMTQANQSLGFTPLSINLSGVNANPYQILEIILKYAEINSNI